MKRPIEGFHRDERGDWIADLRCGHGQRVDEPPRVGDDVDCPRCDRFEVPEGFEAYRRTAEFTEHDLPSGLRANHSTRPGVWGVIHVVAGQLTYIVGAPLQRTICVDPAHPAVIVPEVAHRLRVGDGVRFFVEFRRRSNDLRQSAR